MTQQPDPLTLFATAQRGDPPTRDDLLKAWLMGAIALDEYADLLNHFYPLSVAEALAARRRMPMHFWSAIIARRAAGRAEIDSL